MTNGQNRSKLTDAEMEEVEKITKVELFQLVKGWFESKLHEESYGVEGHIDEFYDEIVENLKLKTTEVLSAFGYQVVQEDDGTAWVNPPGEFREGTSS